MTIIYPQDARAFNVAIQPFLDTNPTKCPHPLHQLFTEKLVNLTIGEVSL